MNTLGNRSGALAVVFAAFWMAFPVSSRAQEVSVLIYGDDGTATEVVCQSVRSDDLLIDEREMTTGLDVEYRKRPGKVKYSNITLERTAPADPPGEDLLHAWKRDAGAGKDIRKNITVVIKADKRIDKSYSFLECSPAAFDVYEEVQGDGSVRTVESWVFSSRGLFLNPGRQDAAAAPKIRVSITDENGVTLMENTLTAWAGGELARVQPLPPADARFHIPSPSTVITNLRLIKEGSPGSEALYAWLNDVAAGKDARKTIRIQEIRANGRPGRSYTYFDCFPVRYVFPQFSDTYIVEELEFAVERVERG